MASVGLILKKEREKKKISLDDVSEETKIGKKYLLAIESDNYTIFPGETYVIGFIRNYARAIGLDPADIINQYKSMKIGTIAEDSRNDQTSDAQKPSGSVEQEPAIKKEVKKTPVKELKKSRKDKDAEELPEEDDYEVVELIEELPEKSKKKKKILTTIFERSKPLKSPLKEKKVINIAHLIIGMGAVIVLLLLILIVKFIVGTLSPKDNIIHSSSFEAKRLEFTENILQTEFVPSEYYEIPLGFKTHNILFETLTELSDVNDPGIPEKESKLEFAFHIIDISVPLKLNEEKLIDFDYDTRNDLKIKVLSYKNNLITARIDKLHYFIVAKSNEQIGVSGSSNTNFSKKVMRKPRTEGASIKEKIIFEAIVIKRKTYFKAYVDSVEKEGTIYSPGSRIRLEANDAIQLQIGSAGSLDVKINGKPHNLGKVGVIVNKIIKWVRDPKDESRYNLIIKDRDD